ncbi:ion transporter [Iodidimonas gelatinilytica]|uniref:Ion transporter n=1 Tax=Iodidimonas gelatinilytica TaxID=1236966 RepID=A0A5A7MQY3_9PROT|nr:ion channel [Iodidimonas gelatinilytica]GEQ98206.1 ion transporter [Iodidimonas gelatinilytica]
MAQEAEREDAEDRRPQNLEAWLRSWYYGETEAAQRFRFTLLGFDILTIAFFLITSMLQPQPWMRWIGYVIAVALSLDYIARLIIANRAWRAALRIVSMADLIVIVSLVAPIIIENLAFLRVLRMLRLLRSYHLLKELRKEALWFRRNEELIESAINLFVFLFVTAAVVYVMEEGRNEGIGTYIDALYFTVAALTTTGFGDITLEGTWGRFLSVLIMVFGVALFLRLVQTIFRPGKVSFPCPNCGLSKHDPDAVHCKHCGEGLKIPTLGYMD